MYGEAYGGSTVPKAWVGLRCVCVCVRERERERERETEREREMSIDKQMWCFLQKKII